MRKVDKGVRKRVFTVGIDEVGRGSLAGPVTVAAVAVAPAFWRSAAALPVPLRDSKHLSPRQREVWFRHVRAGVARGAVRYILAGVSPRVIDRLNVTRAANLAATRAFVRLVTRHALPLAHLSVLLDGGLFLNERKLFALGYSRTPKTVVRGDERFAVIKLASIIAKVSRDRAMGRLHERFPAYGFHVHKGYGTRRHLRALRRHGLSEVHRLTFVHTRRTMKK